MKCGGHHCVVFSERAQDHIGCFPPPASGTQWRSKGAIVDLCLQFLYSRNKKVATDHRDAHAKAKLRIAAMTYFQLLQSLPVHAVHKNMAFEIKALFLGVPFISSPLSLATLLYTSTAIFKKSCANFLLHCMF